MRDPGTGALPLLLDESNQQTLFTLWGKREDQEDWYILENITPKIENNIVTFEKDNWKCKFTY